MDGQLTLGRTKMSKLRTVSVIHAVINSYRPLLINLRQIINRYIDTRDRVNR